MIIINTTDTNNNDRNIIVKFKKGNNICIILHTLPQLNWPPSAAEGSSSPSNSETQAN